FSASLPSAPAGPVSPFSPLSPLGPCAPSFPSAPGSPLSPLGPCAPSLPAGPCGPSTPSINSEKSSPVGFLPVLNFSFNSSFVAIIYHSLLYFKILSDCRLANCGRSVREFLRHHLHQMRYPSHRQPPLCYLSVYH